MLDIKRVTWTLAIWSALTFVVCVAYGLVTPQSIHTPAFLEQILPGFRWLTAQGFAVGLLESFLYGVYGGVTFSAIYNRVYRHRTARAPDALG